MPAALVDLVRAKVSKGFDREVGSRGQFHGPCPSCGGTDRFCVFPDQEPKGDLAVRAGAWGGYWCNQCGMSGDYVQWLVEVEGWDWMKIFEYLGVDGARSAEGKRPVISRPACEPRLGREIGELQELSLPPEKWREHAEKFVSECAAALERNTHLVGWLERRGVPFGVARKSRLGWHAGEPRGNVVPCAYRSREGWGLEPRYNQQGRPKSVWLPRGLVLPNYREGELLAVRVRRPNCDVLSGQKKYIMISGSVQECMITLGAKIYVVVEAALDGLAVMAAGVEGVGMCAMGSLSAYPDREAAEHLSRAQVILQALDFEPQGKGENYGNKFRHWWQAKFPQCRRAPVPIGKDPGEFVERAGLAGLKAWLESQLPFYNVARLAPKPRVEKAPAPAPEGVRLPDKVQRLYGLLASSGGYIMVSPSCGVLGAQLPHVLASELYELLEVPTVKRWLAEIEPGAKEPYQVNMSNFMKPASGEIYRCRK